MNVNATSGFIPTDSCLRADPLRFLVFVCARCCTSHANMWKELMEHPEIPCRGGGRERERA